jgi:hypothetical protein
MTRVDAIRRLLAKPLDHVDQTRIGHRVVFAQPDTRVQLTYIVRVIRTGLKRLA